MVPKTDAAGSVFISPHIPVPPTGDVLTSDEILDRIRRGVFPQVGLTDEEVQAIENADAPFLPEKIEQESVHEIQLQDARPKMNLFEPDGPERPPLSEFSDQEGVSARELLRLMETVGLPDPGWNAEDVACMLGADQDIASD